MDGELQLKYLFPFYCEHDLSLKVLRKKLISMIQNISDPMNYC